MTTPPDSPTAPSPVSPVSPVSMPSVLSKVTTVRVRMLSDWHVGAGIGAPGAMNALVRRDADGLPYLPGTTLTGLLREECRQLARGLDHNDAPTSDGSGSNTGDPCGTWRAWHRYLFGSRQHDSHTDRTGTEPLPAAVSLRAARVAPALAAELTASPRLVEATTFRKPGVAIDHDTGRAADRFLRFTEVARAGMTLHTTLSLPTADLTAEQQVAATVLLVLGLRSLRAVGGDRRRGLGAVEVDLDGGDWGAWVRDCVDWAEHHAPPAPPTPATPRNALDHTTTPAPGDASPQDWVEVPLTLTTVDPVRAPRQTLGNVVLGHAHIPGTTLLAWVLRAFGSTPALRAALVTGTAVITQASPDIGGAPGLPAPAALRSTKHAVNEPLRNALRDDTAIGGKTTGWGVAGHDGRWVEPDPGTAATELVTHNVITVGSGTPTSDDGGVFTVEVIPSGRVLHAVLRVSASVAAALTTSHGPDWPATLDCEATLGSGAKGEYGRVTVRSGASQQVPEPPRKTDELTVWALSDILVRDQRLRHSGSVDDVVAELTRRLGLDRTNLELVSVSARDARVDSWQRSWRLPRPSLVGLAAGSCLLLRLHTPLDQTALTALHTLAASGLGERRGEGFGQVLFNHPLLDTPDTPTNTAPPGAHSPHPGGTTSDPSDTALDPDDTALDPEDMVFLTVVRAVALTATLTGDLHQVPDQVRTDLRSALEKMSPSQRGEVRQAVTTTSTSGGSSLTRFLTRAAARPAPPAALNVLCSLTDPGGVLAPFAEQAATAIGLPAPHPPAVSEAAALLVLDVLTELDSTRPSAPPGDQPTGSTRARPRPAEPARPGPVPRRTHRTNRGDRMDTVLQQAQRVPYRTVHTRWELTATLRTRTPLHVGGSHDDPYVDLTVARDGHGQPYVPGSALAGVLRGWAHQRFGADRVAEVFGGTARRASATRPDDPGAAAFLASLVEVADAPLTAAHPTTTAIAETATTNTVTTVVRDGVGIDRVRAAAAHRVKYEREVVPAGASFTLRVRVDDVEPHDELGHRTPVADILRELESALTQQEFSLGAASSRGLGVVTATAVALTGHPITTRAGVLAELRSTGPTPQPVTPDGPAPGVLRVAVTWRAVGPLMVAGAEQSATASTLPLLERHPDTGDPVPVIPGASVKGVISAEIERALRTFTAVSAGTHFVNARAAIAYQVPAFEALFGSQDRKGALSIPDTYADPIAGLTRASWERYLTGTGTPPQGWLDTTHVAIDRWTGGAAANMLFTVLEPHGLTWAPLRFDIDTTRIAAEHQLTAMTLLLHALAGFAASEVPLGHATHRGMGGAEATAITFTGPANASGTGAAPGRWPTGHHDLGDTSRQRRSTVLGLARNLWADPATWTTTLIRPQEEPG